jgi:selenide,water dikinase
LLVSCAPDHADAITQSIVAAGYPAARVIGRAEAGPPCIRVIAA